MRRLEKGPGRPISANGIALLDLAGVAGAHRDRLVQDLLHQSLMLRHRLPQRPRLAVAAPEALPQIS